jgi:hypothetical protein
MRDIEVIKVGTGEVLPGIPTSRLMQLGGGKAYFIPAEYRAQGIAGVWYALLPEEGYPAPENARVEYVTVRTTDR